MGNYIAVATTVGASVNYVGFRLHVFGMMVLEVLALSARHRPSKPQTNNPNPSVLHCKVYPRSNGQQARTATHFLRKLL